MNIPSLLVCAAFAFAVAAHAQEAAPIKVKVDDVKPSPVQTPQFQISNIPAKAYRPKNWLVLETQFEAAKVAKGSDTSTDVDALEFKYYVALNKVSKSGKYILMTGTIYYINIPVREKTHAMAFVSPSTLTRLLEKADFTPSDIKAVGLEVNYNGALVGGKSSAGKFWEKMDSFDVQDGAVLPKSKTPFAPVWGDYDVETRAQ